MKTVFDTYLNMKNPHMVQETVVPQWDQEELKRNVMAGDSEEEAALTHSHFHQYRRGEPGHTELQDYIKNDTLSQALNDNEGNIWSLSKKHLDRAAIMDKVVNKPSNAATHVYVGLHYNPAEKMSGDGVKVQHHGYTDASHSLHAAVHRADPYGTMGDGEKHVLRLSVPRGTPGASTQAKGGVSTGEEVILHRGLQIHIKNNPTKLDQATVWHGSVVGHDFDPV